MENSHQGNELSNPTEWEKWTLTMMMLNSENFERFNFENVQFWKFWKVQFWKCWKVQVKKFWKVKFWKFWKVQVWKFWKVRASNITYIDPTDRTAWGTTIKEMNCLTPQSGRNRQNEKYKPRYETINDFDKVLFDCDQKLGCHFMHYFSVWRNSVSRLYDISSGNNFFPITYTYAYKP